MNLILILFLCVVSTYSKYSVVLQRVNSGLPVCNELSKESEFSFNYNPAYVPIYAAKKLHTDALLVRCQNLKTPPWEPDPSILCFTKVEVPGADEADPHLITDLNEFSFETITKESVVFECEGEAENYGVEDPRVTYVKGWYYMFYSAVKKEGDQVISKLSLAKSQTPWIKKSWERLGEIPPPTVHWSKAGALIYRDTPPHYLIWGDKNLTLSQCQNDELTEWTEHISPFMTTRETHFDSYLVESGPHPLKLDDGNYFFIYNSAQAGHPSERPGYELQYNVGYLILDGQNPGIIVQRSEFPILSPQLKWETGEEPYLGLVPNVVFLEGIKELGDNTFLVFYGAADAVIGTAIIKVQNESAAPNQQQK